MASTTCSLSFWKEWPGPLECGPILPPAGNVPAPQPSPDGPEDVPVSPVQLGPALWLTGAAPHSDGWHDALREPGRPCDDGAFCIQGRP
jgi:hypothetical protein